MSYIFEKFDYSLFESRFRDYNRLDNFPKGLRDLFNYLEELANNSDEPYEVDVVGICCSFREVELETVLKEHECETLEELQDERMVIVVDDETVILDNIY